MERIRKLPLENGDVAGAVRTLLRSLLLLEDIDAVMAPVRSTKTKTVFPGLVADPQRLDAVDPTSPCFPLNAAQLLSRLDRKLTGAQLVACLRPCEIRAAIERTKLHQGSLDEVILVGLDCSGAFSNRDYRRFAASVSGDPSEAFLRCVFSNGSEFPAGVRLSSACRACTAFTPDGADIAVGLFSRETGYLLVEARTEKGWEILQRLALDEAPLEAIERRSAVVSSVRESREAFRESMFDTTRTLVDSPEKLAAYFADCVLCTNCRVACPICYCRECVFLTDVFDHEPLQYRKWSQKSGAIRLPRDVVFFHLTRLVHMSTGCVGCGQCSNACPNDIHVMELFTAIASRTQRAFGYEPGRSLDEPPPLTVFEAEEFAEAVG